MTLHAFGITKSFTHRGYEEVLGMPLVVAEVATERKLECYGCYERFCNNQGLSVHLKCRHGVMLKPSNVTECINEVNQCKNVESTSSSTKSTDSLQSLKSTDTIQPAECISSESIILGTSSGRTIELKVENHIGHHHRTSRTNLFKSKIIELRESGKTPNEIMDMHSGHVSLSPISKWIKNRAKIMKAAAGEYKKMFYVQPPKKYIRLYSELTQVFSTARN